jgi:hypothetical protein
MGTGATRNSRFLLCALGGLAVFAVVTWALWNHIIAWTNPISAGPRLQLRPLTTTNLGQGKPGEILEGALRLRNIGSEPLLFQIDPNCGCTHLRPSQGEIEPGEALAVHVGIRLRKGRNERVHLAIQTNDPQKPFAQHTFIATCPAPILISPSMIDLGDVVEGTSPTSTFQILDPQGKPLRSPLPIVAETSSPHLSCERQQADSGEGAFIVTLNSDTPRGSFSGEITLKLPSSDVQETVPVVARIQGSAMVSPARVFLHFDPETRKPREAFIFVWRTDGDPLGRLISKETPKGITIEEMNDKGAKRRRFRVRAVDNDLAALDAIIKLRFEGVSEDVIVRIELPERINSSGVSKVNEPNRVKSP